MSETLSNSRFTWPRWLNLRSLLDALAALGALAQPLTTAEGLRAALTHLLELARLLGIDPAWIDRLEQVLASDDLLHLVLALIGYITGTAGHDATDDALRVHVPAENRDVHIGPEQLQVWLPWVVHLVGLLRQIRGLV